MSHEIKPASLPAFLAPTSPDTLPFDTPVFVAADHVYLQHHTNNLFIDNSEPLIDKPREDEAPSHPFLGKVALMKIALNEGAEVQAGYVIDIRFADTGDFAGAPPEEPIGVEEVDAAFDMAREHMYPVAAFAYIDPAIGEYETRAGGDRRFGAATLHLAELVDKLIAGEAGSLERNTPRLPEETATEEEVSDASVAAGKGMKTVKPRLLDFLGGVVDVVKANAEERMVVRELTRGLNSKFVSKSYSK